MRQESLLSPQQPGVWCFSILSGAFPVPAAVLAQVCWAAAKTSLPGSLLTLVSFLGSRLVGLSVKRNTVGLGYPGHLGARQRQ